MPDISMCTGKGCPMKDSCYRFTAKPSYRQAYLSVPPFQDGGCRYWWPKDKNETSRQSG
jgi:hypothetical protein